MIDTDRKCRDRGGPGNKRCLPPPKHSLLELTPWTPQLWTLIESTEHSLSPAREIQDPQLFVGRREEIESGISALMNRGGFLTVFGLRGVGKSSIAYQLGLIATGDKDLPKLLAIERSLPRKGFNYLVHYVRCDRFVDNVVTLLRRLLFGDETNPSLFSLTHSGDRKLVEFRRTLEAEGGLGIFSTKIGSKGTEQKTYAPFVSDDLIQQFRQLLGAVRKDNQAKSGLLILIDEFDIVGDKSGFSSIVKACSSDFVKFGVVGIATSVGELVQDHESIGRQIDIVNVPLMPENELRDVLRRAEYIVGRTITFASSARDTICERAEGFPYFVHLLGKEAMMLAYRRGSSKVTGDDIDQLAGMITGGRLNTIYEDTYHRAVKNSTQREILLKIFAEQEKDEISTEPVYSLAKDLGIGNPSQLMKELTAPDSGPVILTRVRQRYYRFADPVFKVYARMRQWKF